MESLAASPSKPGDSASKPQAVHEDVCVGDDTQAALGSEAGLFLSHQFKAAESDNILSVDDLEQAEDFGLQLLFDIEVSAEVSTLGLFLCHAEPAPLMGLLQWPWKRCIKDMCIPSFSQAC